MLETRLRVSKPGLVCTD